MRKKFDEFAALMNQAVVWIHMWTFFALWSLWVLQTAILVADIMARRFNKKREPNGTDIR